MDVQFLERVAESSPVIVLILLVACGLLWRTLREEIASCRTLHVQSIEAQRVTAETQRQLSAAIEQLSKRIEGAR